MSVEKYSVGIIGAGNIASGFDDPSSSEVLTHAHAFSLHKRISRLIFYDRQTAKAKLAAHRWSAEAVPSFSSFMKRRPDIIVLCTPDRSHYSVLIELLDGSPRLVLCEKPLTAKSSDSFDIVRRYRRKKVPLLVNYQRRFDPAVNALKRDFQNGRLGRILNVSVRYSKGILHNGSHAVDLLRFLFGEATRICVMAYGLFSRPTRS